MKRIASLVFCILILMSSAACSENNNKSDNDGSTETSAVQKTSEPEDDEEYSDEPAPEVSYSFENVEYHEELPDFMKTNTRLYAGLLEKALKIYYSGVITGKINNDTYIARYCKDKLPNKDAAPEERKKLADLCTVGGALEYFGFDCAEYTKYYEMYNGCLKYFSCDHDGYIYYYENAPRDTSFRMNSINQTMFFIFKTADINRIEREAASFAADEINFAVKEYYNGIQSGIITSSIRRKYTSDVLPGKKATQFDRLRLANEATVAGALDYAGYFTALYPYIKKVGYNRKTHVITSLEQHNPDIVSFVSDEVKLSQIYGKS